MPASKFIEKKDNTYVTEHVVGIAKDVPEEIKQGLRENFNGECSEVGSRGLADRAELGDGTFSDITTNSANILRQINCLL